jgi:hypothetical protein
MKTENLRSFNYSSPTAVMCVNATAFDSRVNGKFYRVRVIDNGRNKVHCPQSREEAEQIADEAIAAFVTTLYRTMEVTS